MAVPQANVQQRQDLSSFLAGNISQSVANRQRAAGDALGNVLDVAKTAYGIGSDVYTKVKQQEALQASGQDTKLTAILTNNGTTPPDPAMLRARMLINPDLAKQVAELDRYKTRGTYARDPADEVSKDEYLTQITQGNSARFRALKDLSKGFGDKIDASERKVLSDLYNVWAGTDLESRHALDYANDLGGMAYLTEEDGDAQTPQLGADGAMQDASLQPGMEGTASKGGMASQTGQPPLGSTGLGLLSNASTAASQAQGRMEPRGQVGATTRKPLILGMAPGMTTETVRQAQGTPQLQAAYAAAPQNLAKYWGVKPEAVQAAYAGLSESGLPTDPTQRTQLMASWSKQIQTALPGIFPPTNTPEQTVKEALALRSGAAHTALASTLKGGQPVLPTDDKGQPILYVPNTGGAVQAPTAPATTLDNKTAQTGGLTNVGFSTGIQPSQEPQGGVALGVDEGVLRSAEMKAAQGQPLTREETLARSNLHRIASAHVKVNGDALVGGVPLKELVRNYDQRIPEIENGIRKLNGMGLTVEDMMDPTLTSFQGYMSLLKPAQAAFVEKNKPIQDLINNIISFKQDEHAGQNIELAGKGLELQRQELGQRIKAHQDNLKLQYAQLGAEGVLADPNSTAAQKQAAAATKQLQTSYNQYLTRWNTAVTTLGGYRKALEYVERNKNKPDDIYVGLYNSIVQTGRALTNDPTYQPGDPATTTSVPSGQQNTFTQMSGATQTATPQSPLSGTGTSSSNVDAVKNKFNINPGQR